MTEPLDIQPDKVKVKTGREVVTALSAHVPDLDEAQITQVLEALNRVREGADLGVVMRDPVTGSVAHRVDAEGVMVWRVSEPDGGTDTDMQPTLPWEQIYPV